MGKNRILEMKSLQEVLGIAPLDLEQLSVALTHPSYAVENSDCEDNQRLEFLGDAVVDLCIGEYLYREYPDEGEGLLSKKRATLVCEDSLANAAKRLDLGCYLRLGRGEKANGGDERPSNLADAWEAMCAVIYLSVGIVPLYDLLLKYLAPEIELVADGYYGDYKTRLQEFVQRNGQTVTYRLLKSKGPDHNKVFTSEVCVDEVPYGIGEGKTKKLSEREAAFQALVKLGELDDQEA